MINAIDISTFLDIDTISSIEKIITANLRNRRKEQHLSQKELSQKSGVSYASLRRFESTGEIALTSLIKLAFVLDCQNDFKELFSHSRAKNLKDMV